MNVNILSDEDLNAAMRAHSTPVRVTEEMIEARIATCEFEHKAGTTLTRCTITLDNGFVEEGKSACVDPANFNPDVGRTWAYKDAIGKLEPMFGFMLAEDRYRATCGGTRE